MLNECEQLESKTDPHICPKTVIKLTDINKTYKMGGSEVCANKSINLEILEGEFVVIMGASGSGKSTLMNMIGCLDRPTEGSYVLDGKEVSKLSDDELAVIRNQKIGFVFQKFHLLAGSSAIENVELPMIYSGVTSKDRAKVSRSSLFRVGLGERGSHNPSELSGGEMQRVAVARSLVNRPAILLADEPTGNLDTKSGNEIMTLFQELHRQGKTIILVTHNPQIVKYGTRIVKMEDGKIIMDKPVKKREILPVEMKKDETSSEDDYRIRGSMNFFQSFRIAWKALRANKLRSLLTMLGIIIGVSSVIVMNSIGEGTRQHVMSQISSLGSNLIIVSPGSRNSALRGFISSKSRMLTMRDVEFIEGKCTLIKGIAPCIFRSLTVRYLSNNMIVDLVGSTTDFLHVRNFSIDKGRFFSEQEMESRAAVCVLGADVTEKLFGLNEDPLGKTVKVSIESSDSETERTDIRLTVIGVLKRKGDSWRNNEDEIIVAPLNTVRSRLFDTDYISVIYLEAKSSDKMNQAIREVRRVLMPLHNNKPENLNLRSQDQILERMSSTLGAFTLMLIGIAFVSLIVGGIGIMNIMLVSVTERTKEIGLRKAIGAKKRDIMFQFLVESLVLAVTGGIIGILIGVGLAKIFTVVAVETVFNRLSKTIISFKSIALSFTYSAIVGIFFGLYPARKAASLDPIEALRYE